jgi:hypothetical protein
VARWFRSSLSVGPFVSRGITSPTMLRFHVSPSSNQDVRISRIRLSDGLTTVRPTVTLRRTWLPLKVHPSHVRSVGGLRQSPAVSTAGTFPKSGPFPPRALPRFDSTTNLSDSPGSPACPSRASGWAIRPPLGVSRVCVNHLTDMPSPLPRRDRWWDRVAPLKPATTAFPTCQLGRLPH